MKGKPGKTVCTGIGDTAAIPVIDYERCTSCGACVKVCSSLTIIDIEGRPTIEPDNGLGCFACGQCVAACAFDAIRVTGRRMAPDDVLPWPDSEKTADAESLHNLMLKRRSVRSFKPEPVAQSDIDRIMEMTAAAPMGIAPSDVECTVVMGNDKVQELAGDLNTVFLKWKRFFNPVVMLFMRIFKSRAEYESFDGFLLPIINEMAHAREQGQDVLFYSAPCVMLFHTPPQADPVDGSIACTYAMLAAHSLGLGTCMIGTVAPTMNMEKKLKKKWRIPADHTVNLAMIVGHPAHRYHRVIRRRLGTVHTIASQP